MIAVEALWLRAKGWSVGAILCRLGPGALILVALREALTGGVIAGQAGRDWYRIALPLALSFPLHLCDLAREAGRERGGQDSDWR